MTNSADIAFAELSEALVVADAACVGDGRVTLDTHEFQAEEVAFLSARVCWPCPVRAQCRAYAEAARPQAGIWAGRVYGPRRNTPISDSP